MLFFWEIHVLCELITGLLFSLHVSQSLQLKVPERVSKDIEPWFSEPIPNVTVAEGRSVTLPCVVEYLGNYRLAWIHKDRHILLTLHERVITRNPRITIFHNNHRTWWLNIANVELSDQGQYMCQINTAPMKSQVGFLTVVVPPSIDEDFTSSDMSVREGADSVSLRCRASGSPEPDIKWRREDDRDIVIGAKRAPTIPGQFLTITKVSRQHMGAYLCIASNGVQPTVSKRIMLNVNFSPMILIPNQLVWAPLASDVTLICNLESHPRAISYWVMTGGIVIISNDKYDVLTEQTSIYKVKLSLHIRNLRPGDFGDYTCVAKNSLGDNEGTITLYEKATPVTYGSGEEQMSSASQSHMDKFTNNEFIPIANNIKQDVTKRTETKTEEVEQTYKSAGVHQKNSFPGMHGSTNSSVIHLLNSSALTLLVLLYILL